MSKNLFFGLGSLTSYLATRGIHSQIIRRGMTYFTAAVHQLMAGASALHGKIRSRKPKFHGSVSNSGSLGRSSVRLADIVLVIGLGTVIVPEALAQNNLTLRVTPDYVLSSYGRQLSFDFTPHIFSLEAAEVMLTLSGSSLVVNLPPSVSFSSATVPASVSGSVATGERVALNMGTVTIGRFFRDLVTVSIASTVADGTTLQAAFDFSGTLSPIPSLGIAGGPLDSGPVNVSFRAGYLPVVVFVDDYRSDCEADVFLAPALDVSGADGSSTSATLMSPLSGAFGLPATALGVTDRMVPLLPAPSTPITLGEIAGPGSEVRVTGLGTRGIASGGFTVAPDLSSAKTLQGTISCRVDFPHLSFSNPNAYPVLLQLDVRTDAFAAAGDVVAGFPSLASAGGASAGSGLSSGRVSKRWLYAPSGDTLRTQMESSCFFDAPFCGAQPPSDTTVALAFPPCGSLDCSLLPPSGGLLIPPSIGASIVFGPDFNPIFQTETFSTDRFLPSNVAASASGNSKIASDASTGLVSLIRSGYGSASVAMSIRVARGDANIGVLEATTPSELQITGHSPINLLVADSQGRRVGFNPAPAPPPLPGTPPPTVSEEPTILAEIFGASYSGPDSSTQVIKIPNPDPANAYQIKVLGTGTGPYLLTMQTFNVDGVMLDQQSQSGTAAPGSSNTFNLTMSQDGHLSLAGAPGSDTIPPTTVAVLSPRPNAAGWNNHDVTVTLSATDDPGGSGVKQITYSASGAQGITSTVVNAVSASIVISTEGVTTLTFFATDNAGNVESAKSITIMLDKTPPVIIPSRTPPPNANGWNNTSVTVSFACTDSLSGLAAGSPPAPTTLTAEGASQSVSGTCKDIAGNTANATVSGISIDKTPPAVSCSANPSMLWPPNHMLVNVNTSVQVTDSLSGPAGFVLLSVTSNEPDSGSGDIQGWAIGTASTSGQLRAERLGQGNGRVYTLTYNGMDRAGNSAACSTTVTVPHDQRRP